MEDADSLRPEPLLRRDALPDEPHAFEWRVPHLDAQPVITGIKAVKSHSKSRLGRAFKRSAVIPASLGARLTVKIQPLRKLIGAGVHGGTARSHVEIGQRAIQRIRIDEEWIAIKIVRAIAGDYLIISVEIEIKIEVGGVGSILLHVHGVLAAGADEDVIEHIHSCYRIKVKFASAGFLRRVHVVVGRVIHYIDMIAGVNLNPIAAIVVDNVIGDQRPSDVRLMRAPALAMPLVVDDDSFAIGDLGLGGIKSPRHKLAVAIDSIADDKHLVAGVVIGVPVLIIGDAAVAVHGVPGCVINGIAGDSAAPPLAFRLCLGSR